jgi:hypothetical protein
MKKGIILLPLLLHLVQQKWPEDAKGLTTIQTDIRLVVKGFDKIFIFDFLFTLSYTCTHQEKITGDALEEKMARMREENRLAKERKLVSAQFPKPLF